MDLKAQKAQRRVLRTAVTLSANKIESELKNDVVDLQKISLLQVQLKDKYLRLEAAQEAVSGTLLQLEDNGEEFETDFIDAESYREKYLEYYTRIDKKLGETVISEVPDTPRKFKLPKLELRKIRRRPEGVPFRFGASSKKSMTTEASQMKTRCSILWLQLNPNRKRKEPFLVFRLLQRITRRQWTN
ncbi:uncharacterized protein TNCV_4477021 [Trichonephila clavipes]|nr:uncharacterized protein TNCV_4477021 [Trichonephila clavipes]